MGVTLEIHTAALLPELIKRLSTNGCVAHAVDERVCHVVHPKALDSAEELAEVRFFLRAWQVSKGGVEVTLRPDESPVVDGSG